MIHKILSSADCYKQRADDNIRFYVYYEVMRKAKEIQFGSIYTPQGALRDVMRNPNLDLMMNLFHIPRAYAVSGFGDWDVGRHSACTAFIALYWSRLRRMPLPRRNEFVVLALLHDLHEAVTGDILPFFKTIETKTAIAEIQLSFLKSLNLAAPEALRADIKVADMTAFLYEIKQSSAAALQRPKVKWLKRIYRRQRRELIETARTFKISAGLTARLLRELEL